VLLGIYWVQARLSLSTHPVAEFGARNHVRVFSSTAVSGLLSRALLRLMSYELFAQGKVGQMRASPEACSRRNGRDQESCRERLMWRK